MERGKRISLNDVGSDAGGGVAVAVTTGAPVAGASSAAGSSPRATVVSRGPAGWKEAAASGVCLPAISATSAWKTVAPLSIATTYAPGSRPSSMVLPAGLRSSATSAPFASRTVMRPPSSGVSTRPD